MAVFLDVPSWRDWHRRVPVCNGILGRTTPSWSLWLYKFDGRVSTSITPESTHRTVHPATSRDQHALRCYLLPLRRPRWPRVGYSRH